MTESPDGSSQTTRRNANVLLNNLCLKKCENPRGRADDDVRQVREQNSDNPSVLYRLSTVIKTHRCSCSVTPLATFTSATSLSQYLTNPRKCPRTCSASSRVGTRISALVDCRRESTSS